jgi:hypothetical protein
MGVARTGWAAEVSVKGVQDLPSFQKKFLQERSFPILVTLLFRKLGPDPLKKV